MLNIKQYIKNLLQSHRPTSYKFQVGDLVKIKESVAREILIEYPSHYSYIRTHHENYIYTITSIQKESQNIIWIRLRASYSYVKYLWKPEWLELVKSKTPPPLRGWTRRCKMYRIM